MPSRSRRPCTAASSQRAPSDSTSTVDGPTLCVNAPPATSQLPWCSSAKISGPSAASARTRSQSAGSASSAASQPAGVGPAGHSASRQYSP